LPAWGINTIRLLFTWEAYETIKCSYDNDYIEYYEQVVRWAAERGIYVIVDFHQDAYSRFSLDGCGEGFPEWAVTPEVELKTPDNGEKCASWGTKMIIDLSHHKTWEHFHSDRYGAQTRYLNMVEAVADRMSQHPNVIGYELMNEPWGFDDELHRLFEKIGARIRGRHPNTILFVPPHALVSGGMSDNNIEKPTFCNFVYSPHFYDGSVILFQSWLGTDPTGPLDKLRDKAETWQVPMVLSEFGAPADTSNVEDYMEVQFDWLDKYWISSVQWCYTPGWQEEINDGWNMEDLSIVDGEGRMRANFMPRPYPQKISGTPGEFKRDDNGFIMTWGNNPQAGATEIYIPDNYADDKQMSLTLPDGISGNCALGSQSIRCSINGPGNVILTLSK
jgi:endoglycosylceramidase